MSKLKTQASFRNDCACYPAHFADVYELIHILEYDLSLLWRQ